MPKNAALLGCYLFENNIDRVTLIFELTNNHNIWHKLWVGL